MPDTQQMLVIEQTKLSGSGKSMGIRSGDVWYSCKDLSIERLQGHTIMANTSVQNFADGGSINWINSYTPPQAGHQIPQQSMPDGQVQVVQTAPPQVQQVGASVPVNPAPAPMAPPAKPFPPLPDLSINVIDRDASIVAQTLCKSITFSSPDAAFAAYTGLYELVREWQATGRTPQAEAAQQPQWPDKPSAPHDEIPF